MNIRQIAFICAALCATSSAFAQPHHITELERPLILQFKNEGGYTGWFRVSWTTMEGEIDIHTSNNLSAGSTYTLEVPLSAYLNSVRVEGYTNTGVLWAKYKEIFNFTFENGVDVYTFKSRDYYAIKTWGTTYSPRWATFKPKMEIDGMDPYSDDPKECSIMTISNPDSYTGLINPARTQYNLINACRNYSVLFTLTGQSGRYERTVPPSTTSYVYGGYYDHYWRTRVD